MPADLVIAAVAVCALLLIGALGLAARQSRRIVLDAQGIKQIKARTARTQDQE